MNLISHINAVIIDWASAIYHVVAVDPSQLLPAQLDRAIDQSGVASSVRNVFQALGLVLTVVFGVIVIIAHARKQALKKSAASVQAESTPASADSVPAVGALRERWNEILGHLDSTRENDWKLAVVEADKLVDSALQQAGFPGDTFGDRLTNIQPGSLVTLDGIWWAHRIRNRVAHEIDYFLRYTEARQAVSYFQAALEELQFI